MQQTPDAQPKVTITANNRAQRDARIDAAVASLHQAGIQARAGILVTRKSPRTFTVAISPTVPFGMTKEQDEALLPSRAV